MKPLVMKHYMSHDVEYCKLYGIILKLGACFAVYPNNKVAIILMANFNQFT